MEYIAKIDPQNAIREYDEWKNTNRVENPKPHTLERDDLKWTKAVDLFLSRP
jgi:hypothetical protein